MSYLHPQKRCMITVVFLLSFLFVSAAGNAGGGSRGGGGSIDWKYDDMPVYPQQCDDGPGLLGTVRTEGESCMSDAEYEKAIRKYKQEMREYNSRNLGD